MAGNNTIDFKDPLWITTWLDAALKKEKEKYEKCPVIPDMVPEYIDAQAWGYVIAGYFLVEESFKALLHVHGKEVPKRHSLSTLFDSMEQNDKTILREYYDDYKATIGGNLGMFPFKSLDDFLVNLDGDKSERGDHVGSFDWRYFLIEEKRSQKMPSVSVDYLHEIVFGCIRIIESAESVTFDPSRCIHSWRLHSKRRKKYDNWLIVKMNSEGWDDLGDRLEILWGPDYRGRFDLYLSKGKGQGVFLFAEIPGDNDLPVFDKKLEIETLDVEQSYRNIGVTWPSGSPID